MTPTRILATLAGLALALAGCGRKLEGPAPSLTATTPATVCTEQVTTTLTLSGDGLSPLVTDSLTKDPKLNLPAVSLVPEQTLAGASASGDAVVFPDDPTNPTDSRVRWTSQQTMTADVFPELAVPPGLYTVHVANKNGKTVDLASALLAVPPPTLDKVVADLLCKDQDNEVVLSGDFFLQIGDLQPSITVGPKTFQPKSMADCRALPGPMGVKACKTLTLDLPSQSLDTGTQVVTVKNPTTAACSSTSTTVTVMMQPCPTLAGIAPDLVCTAEGTRDVTVTGTGFLSVDGRTPTLKLGTQSLPTTLSNCVDVTGVGLREAVKACTTAKATVPQGALAPTGASQAFDAFVTNPTPADCTTKKAVKFTTVPQPTVASIVPDLTCTAENDTTVVVNGTGFITFQPSASAPLAYPTVKLGTLALTPTSAAGCAAVAGPVETVQSCTSLTLTVPKAALPPTGAFSNFAVSVTNPDPAGCSSQQSLTYTTVPQPTLASAVPDLACTAEGDTTVTLSGTGFITWQPSSAPAPTYPTVSFGTLALPAGAASGCTAVTGPTETVQSCTTLTVTVPKAALPPAGAFSTFAVRVTNPAPAGCSSQQAVSFTTVPQPSVSSVVADLACTAQGDTTATVNGAGFLTWQPAGAAAATLPTVLVGSLSLTPTGAQGCTAVTGPLETVQSCTSLTITVPKGALPPTGTSSTFAVKVTNPAPAACSSQQAVSFTTAPPPAVTAAAPDLVCTANGDVPVTLTGTGFLSYQANAGSAASLPTVSVGSTSLSPTSMNGCSAVTGPTESVQSCTSLTVLVPQGLAAASYPLTVTNPAPAACASSSTVTVAVEPPPAISSVSPDIATVVNGPVTVTITGTDFITMGSTLPSIQLDAQTLTASSASGCAAIAGTLSGAQKCTSLTFVVPQATAPGSHTVSVTNPAPAACASGKAKLFLAPAPTLASLAPPGMCSVGATTTAVTVQGFNFFAIGSSSVPSVRIGSRTYAPTMNAASCTAITGYSQSIQQCTAMTITVGAGDFTTTANYPASVSNPAPVAATSTQNVVFSVTAPPTLTAVAPASICAGGGALTLTGTNFTPGMVVTLSSPTPQVATSVVLTGTTSATVTFAGPLPVGGPYGVQVVTGTGACSATLASQVSVTSGPVVYFVDPSVVYNGMTTQATVYASGFAASGLTVQIRLSGTTALQTVTSQYNPSAANRILITIPLGQAAGTYDVFVSDSVTTSCPGRLLGAFKVVSATTLSLLGITPPFGYTGSSTAVSISADPSVGGGLKPLPRFYLNPSTPGALAIPLESVAVLDASRATAVVPTGQALGTYDLIVVNPTGDVGVLSGAFKVLSNPTPFIDVVSPALLVSQQTAAPVSISGGNFRSGAVVSMRCRDLTGNIIIPAVTTGAVTSTTAAATVNTTTPPNGSACVVRLTNTDGSFADYSTVAIVNPAQKPSGFVAGSLMTQGRRGLVGSEGNVTRSAQFLYAIGGDDGASTPTATDSIDVAPLDIYGKPGAFFTQRYRMTVPRSLATGQRVGRWIYVAGGRTGTTVHATIERAYLLDPKDKGQFTNVAFNLTPDASGGLAPGVYSYRVAPVMGGGDAFNPGGENLPSDPFPISVPSITGAALTLTLQWAAVTGATSYRVYRVVNAGDPAGSEVLLAEVAAPATSYTDDGTVTPAGLTPQAIGSTGVWKVVATMPAAREGAGSGTAWDPDTVGSPTARYFYVVGGRDGSGTTLASALKLPLTVNADASQAVGTLVTETTTLASARWQLGVMVANANTASVAGTAQYLFAVGGIAGTVTAANQVATVGTAGELGSWSNSTNLTPARAGFAATLVDNLLLGFGGKNASPDQTGSQAQMAAPAPTLGSWSSTSGQLTVARYLAAGTLHGPFVYVLGGTSGTGALLSTDQMTW